MFSFFTKFKEVILGFIGVFVGVFIFFQSFKRKQAEKKLESLKKDVENISNEAEKEELKKEIEGIKVENDATLKIIAEKDEREKKLDKEMKEIKKKVKRAKKEFKVTL